MIAFLHTSPVHVDTFERLVRAIEPSLAVHHAVDETLLLDAQRLGADDPSVVQRVQAAMAQAASNGASVVVCTCSTIGGVAERMPTAGRFVAARIDRAMADRAAKLGPRILLVAALESTLAPTTSLLQESATALGAEVAIESLLVGGAWPHFLRGGRVAYIETIAAAVRATSGTADVIVLAQASMAPAADVLGDVGVEVLSSPVLGVERAVAQWQTLVRA